jgi:hypothetical protein
MSRSNAGDDDPAQCLRLQHFNRHGTPATFRPTAGDLRARRCDASAAHRPSLRRKRKRRFVNHQPILESSLATASAYAEKSSHPDGAPTLFQQSRLASRMERCRTTPCCSTSWPCGPPMSRPRKVPGFNWFVTAAVKPNVDWCCHMPVMRQSVTTYRPCVHAAVMATTSFE